MGWATADSNPTFGNDVYGNMKAPGAPPATYTDDKLAREKYQQALNEAFAYGPNAKAATVAPVGFETGYADESRGYLSDHASMLAAIASGKAAGIVDPAARANLANAAAANQAYAVSRGQANPAASMRALGNTNDAMNAGAEARIAAMRAQEQKAADAAAVSTLAGMRAGDQAQAFEKAKLDQYKKLADAAFSQQTALGNQAAWQAAHGMKAKAVGASHAYDVDSFNNDMARKRAVAGDTNWRDQWNTMKDRRNDAQTAEYVNTGVNILDLWSKSGGK